MLLLWLLGGLKVASLSLEGGQVAVLRLHAAVSVSHVTNTPYSPKSTSVSLNCSIYHYSKETSLCARRCAKGRTS